MKIQLYYSSNKSAFSIVELSVVALVIAILVGIVANASGLVLNANLATARSLTKSSPVNDLSDDLVLWYETTMPQSIDDVSADDNEFVSTWYDLSPYKNNAIAGSAPSYIKDGINGLPVLRFDGNDYLEHDMLLLNNGNYTMIMVTQRHSDSGKYFFGYASSPATGGGIIMQYLDNNPNKIRVNHGSAGSYDVDVNVFKESVPNIFIFDYDLNATIARAYVGGNLSNEHDFIVSSEPLNLGDTNYHLGGHLANYFTGDFAEVIMFNRLLSDTERKDIERYLGKKWGIDVAS